MTFSKRRLSVLFSSLTVMVALQSGTFAFGQNPAPAAEHGIATTTLPGIMGPNGTPVTTTFAAEKNYVYREPSMVDDVAHQGITLHGHWTIDVKNADGTPAQHHEFENQLQYDGTQYLTALLSGYAVAGDYAIYFTNATATPTSSPTTNVVCPAPASTTTSTFPYCSIVQNINSQPGIFHCIHYVCVGGLTATPTFGSGTGLPNFTLAGSITAPQAGAIVNVYVFHNGCNGNYTTTPPTPTGPATITPTACETQIEGSYVGTMSGTTITPVTVVAGQIIQITVTYTFS
jgi:hypothetical protein